MSDRSIERCEVKVVIFFEDCFCRHSEQGEKGDFLDALLCTIIGSRPMKRCSSIVPVVALVGWLTLLVSDLRVCASRSGTEGMTT